MLCPLAAPFDNTVKPKELTLCADGNCALDCAKPKRYVSFGVMFDCDTALPQIPETTGDMLDEFYIEKVLSNDEKSSASKTVIMFGKHYKTGLPVVFKSFTQFEKDPTLSQQLLYEALMYHKMRNFSKAIPHVVPYVSFYIKGDEELDPNMSDMLHTALGFNYQAHTHHFLITARAPGVTLFEYSTTYIDMVTKDSLLSIFFQITFCLYAMAMSGFQHNDLHTNNIFVDLNPPCKLGMYKIGDRVFEVPTPVLVRIYDFDMGSCATCGRNEYIEKELCPLYGVCNQRNDRFDVFTLYSHFMKTSIPRKFPDIGVFIQIVLGPEKLTQHFRHRMCNETQERTWKGTLKCEPFPVGYPKTIMSPLDILMTMFPQFELTAPQNIREAPIMYATQPIDIPRRAEVSMGLPDLSARLPKTMPLDMDLPMDYQMQFPMQMLPDLPFMDMPVDMPAPILPMPQRWDMPLSATDDTNAQFLPMLLLSSPPSYNTNSKYKTAMTSMSSENNSAYRSSRTKPAVSRKRGRGTPRSKSGSKKKRV